MSRRQNDSLSELASQLFIVTPIWVGPVVALFTWMVFYWIAPALMPQLFGNIDMTQFWHQIFRGLAWIAGAVVLLAWFGAEMTKYRRRKMLDGQTGLSSIRDLTWRQFEHLVCEAYRRRGYLAEVVGTQGNDGGVDVILTGHGETVLVQCKQWKAWRVGVGVVRDLRGVVADRRATRGIVVTSGGFTKEAVAFAQRNPIELVDGPKLTALIAQVQQPEQAEIEPASAQSPQSPTCPLCGSSMVRRTARRGAHAGSEFWGCERYPGCRGIRPISEQNAVASNDRSWAPATPDQFPR
ncbi:MAG: restriction endonuclease [Phycisphaeraceae bacterium]|nr:restriction endonuclease [Phycisphaeraceae bacterium]